MRPTRQRLITAAVDEARYLAASTNTHRYRLIMRYFFEQHRLHHYALAPAQVLAHIRTVLPDYGEDDCQQDLDVLVRWGNLDPDWELGLAGVRTIEDFKRRNVLYGATPDAIAIEELMVRLETQGEQVGELDSSGLSRVWELLDHLELAMARSDAAQIHQAWDDLWLRFSQFSASANQYMGNMRSQERERLLDLEAFQLYKEALILYLTGFTEGLATFRERINRRIEAWDYGALAFALAQEARSSSRAFETHEYLLQQFQQQVTAFRDWFAPGGSADQLRLFASHAIERVVRSARRLSDSRRGAISRAQDLLALADRFHASPNRTHTERIAALTLGLTLPRHWQLEVPEQASDQPESSAWDAAPLDTAIRLRRLHANRRQDLGGAWNDEEQKKAALRAQDRQKQQEAAALVDRLLAGGTLVLSEAGTLAPADRDLILGWIYECLANTPGYSTRTADGSTLWITNPDVTRYVWLESADGRVLVPDFCLEREKGVRLA